MKKEITEGEELRWGYGYCWTNYSRMTFTIAPIPLNFLFRWIRELYFYLRSPQRSKNEQDIQNKMRERYSIGYKDGKKYARANTIREFGEGLNGGIKRFENMIDKWKEEGYYFDPLDLDKEIKK